jgi:hypothetical protein
MCFAQHRNKMREIRACTAPNFAIPVKRPISVNFDFTRKILSSTFPKAILLQAAEFMKQFRGSMHRTCRNED